MNAQLPCQRLQAGYFASLTLGALILMLFSVSAQAQLIFQTQRAVIYYNNATNLLEMEGRLRFSQAENFYQRYFYTQDAAQAALSPGLAAKVDGLLTRVCLILSRWPQKNQQLRIFLLKDGKQVRQRQLALQPVGRELPFFGYGSLEGFYEPRTRSIFLSLADLHAGILAHEMAHFVLCEASPVPPPEDLQDDWARHVERSLN